MSDVSFQITGDDSPFVAAIKDAQEKRGRASESRDTQDALSRRTCCQRGDRGAALRHPGAGQRIAETAYNLRRGTVIICHAHSGQVYQGPATALPTCRSGERSGTFARLQRSGLCAARVLPQCRAIHRSARRLTSVRVAPLGMADRARGGGIPCCVAGCSRGTARDHGIRSGL